MTRTLGMRRRHPTPNGSVDSTVELAMLKIANSGLGLCPAGWELPCTHSGGLTPDPPPGLQMPATWCAHASAGHTGALLRNSAQARCTPHEQAKPCSKAFHLVWLTSVQRSLSLATHEADAQAAGLECWGLRLLFTSCCTYCSFTLHRTSRHTCSTPGVSHLQSLLQAKCTA